MKIFGFAGYSGSGKTTLIEKLIPILVGEGYRIAIFKHVHHDFDIDVPGKDSHRHRKAGAQEVLVSSGKRWALMHELLNEAEPSLDEHLRRLSPCDIVFVEGCRNEALPKMETHRRERGHPFLFPKDPNIVGIASDMAIETDLPGFDIDRADLIAAFIKKHLGIDS